MLDQGLEGADPLGGRLNELHRLAQSALASAVEHAVEAGRLLLDRKTRLPHGAFGPWVEGNCDFSYRTARLYMQAARQSGNGLPVLSLRALLGESRPARTKTVASKLPPMERLLRRFASQGGTAASLASAIMSASPALAAEVAAELAKLKAAREDKVAPSEDAGRNAEQRRPAPRPGRQRAARDPNEKLQPLIDHYREHGQDDATLHVFPESRASCSTTFQGFRVNVVEPDR